MDVIEKHQKKMKARLEFLRVAKLGAVCAGPLSNGDDRSDTLALLDEWLEEMEQDWSVATKD